MSGPTDTASVAPRETSRGAVLRWAGAMAVSSSLLLYFVVRSAIVAMAGSRAEPVTIVLLIAILFTLCVTTWNQRSLLPSRRFPWSRSVVFVVWCLACGAGIAFVSDDNIPRGATSPLFVIGTLWAPWLGWLFYDRPSRRRRIVEGLLVFAGLMTLSQSLKVIAMRGDNTVDFDWKWVKPRDFLIPPPVAKSDEALPGFRPTEHDFPQYLGTFRTAHVALASGLAENWKTPPREVWRKTVGPAWSGFAVRGDYAITQEQRGNEEYVVCYRIADGEIMWSAGNAARFESPMGGIGPRATPTIADDGRVYTMGGTGFLQCIEGTTGTVAWSCDILADNDGAPIAHGVCGSPLVDGDRMIVAPTGNNKVCLAAYDRFSGQQLWQAGAHAASYSAPVIVELAGRRQLLLHAAVAIESHDPETGELLWEFPWSNEYDNNCSQPIIIDAEQGRLIVTSGYGRGAALIEVRSGASGWTVATLWTSRDMKTKFTSAVRMGDAVYGLDEGILGGIDLNTGKRLWKKGRYNHGQILAVGSLLFVQAENGDIALVDPRPDEFVELARWPLLNNKTWNNPTVAGKWILVRNAEEAVCLEWPAALSGGSSDATGKPAPDGTDP